MKKKKTIEIHGKTESLEVTRLDMLTGNFNELAKYGTKSQDEYEKKVRSMDRTDLETHARDLGLVPVDGLERLREKLIHEFRVYTNSLYKPKPPVSAPLSEAVLKILAQGK